MKKDESEETEVKNMKWFKKKLDDIEVNTTSLQNHDAIWMLNRVHELYDQLDEPEVLSSDWIDEHEEQEEMYGTYGVPVHKLQNLLVPKQELPAIPKFVADYIDDRKEVGFPIYQAIRIVREDSRFEHSHLREWLWTNKGQETFVRAWLDGYEVAEEREQKYYVDLESAAYVAKWDGNGQVDIYTDGISGSDEYELHLTEREIKDYDPRFWPFAVKIEELEE